MKTGRRTLGSEKVRQFVPEPASGAVADPRRRSPRLRALDVRLEETLLEQPGSYGAAGDHRQLRVAVEGPGVEIHRAEADDRGTLDIGFA